MRNRRPFVKVGLRLLKLRHPAKRKQINAILRDDDLFDAVTEELSNTAAKDGVGEDGGLLALLQWFIDHADEIFALIEKLIALFTSPEEPEPV